MKRLFPTERAKQTQKETDCCKHYQNRKVSRSCIERKNRTIPARGSGRGVGSDAVSGVGRADCPRCSLDGAGSSDYIYIAV